MKNLIMKHLADACLGHVACHHFTGNQGAVIVAFVIIILVSGIAIKIKR